LKRKKVKFDLKKKIMLIEKNGIKISFGRAVGHLVEDFIGTAKQRIYIISPWISPKYAELLLKKKEKGCDVFLITTNDTSNTQHLSSLKMLLEKKVEAPKLRNYLPYLFAASVLFLFLSIFSLIFLIPFFLLLLVCMYLFFKKEKVSFAFKLPMIVYNKDNDFTHSKLYVLDDIAIIGSANFTESGLWRNIEEVVIFSDKSTVEEIVEIFNRIKENELIKQLTPDEVGKEIE
jgi:phosphatidylserine/phosphatidylglycerophosphate/cardiolipin synthase-like enzyme